MGDEAESVAPAQAVDPSVWRRRVWLAVAAVVGLWAAIYVTVVLAYVVGAPAAPADAHGH